jgi:hypothetical protein
MSKFRYSVMALAAFCALYATSGQAQKAGTYTGKAADGSPISFTVGTDGYGKLAVTGATFTFTAKCNGVTPSSFSATWGFSGFDAEIKNQKAGVTFQKGGGYYVYGGMSFDFATSPVSGTTLSRTAILVTSTTAPSKAEFCYSAVQAFTATLSPSATAEPALPTGAAILLR